MRVPRILLLGLLVLAVFVDGVSCVHGGNLGSGKPPRLSSSGCGGRKAKDDLGKPEAAGAGTAARAETRVVRGVTVTHKGKPLSTGDVDVGPTLDRIRAGGTFPHKNDGAVFINKEGLLPAQPQGYYREWVHPTPEVSGPGPQRIITGSGGELYYTPDHYKTFIPLN